MIRLLLTILLTAPLLIAGEPCGQPDLTKPCMAWHKPAVAVAAGLSIANAGDYWSTRKALKAGGHEANPLMGGLVNHEPAFAAVKLGLGGAISYIVFRGMRDQRKSVRLSSMISGLAATGLFVWVTRHNLGVAHELEQRRKLR